MLNLSDFFRSLFGPFKQKLGPSEFPSNIQKDFEELYGGQEPLMNPEGWIVHHWHEDDLEFSEGELFQEFEQTFQNFFEGFPFDVTPQIQGSPGIHLPPDLSLQEHISEGPKSLRERMLKGANSSSELDKFQREELPNDSKVVDRFHSFGPLSLFKDLFRIPFHVTPDPNEKVDRDLDNEVEMGTQSLDDILSQRNDPNMLQGNVPHSSLSSFSSVTTVINSNGVTEKRTTKKNSNGGEEVMVTRQIGDQTHTIIHRKDGNGNEETQEDLVNIDGDDLPDFDKKWNNSKYNGTRPNVPLDDISGQSTFSTIYDSILEQFFPRKR
ncbi:uncharacterized protein LOC114975547 [Acropora millepora]|uniref:uncharacterized protein LOC114975547 n=1 Tax=Acropora millepora TaxID=45264 RepID=UPI001CF22544|nr:uncharacterized protein LOC114975547 [Acropora millepora]